MRAQTEAAIGEADLILFLVDAKAASPNRFYCCRSRPPFRQAGYPCSQQGRSARRRVRHVRFLARSWRPCPISANTARGCRSARRDRRAIGEERVFPDEYLKPSADDAVAATIPATPRSMDDLIGDDIDDPDVEDVPPTINQAPAHRHCRPPECRQIDLVNTMVGQERLLTGPKPASPAIPSPSTGNGTGTFKIFDTAPPSA